MPRSNRVQLRVCSLCDKPGHNRSTCPDKFLSQKTEKPENTPAKTGVNFYIHHVSAQSYQSPHVLDLKKSRNTQFEQVTPSAPTKDNSFYHSYHKQVVPQTEPVKSVAETSTFSPPAPTLPHVKIEEQIKIEDAFVPIQSKTKWVDTETQFTPKPISFKAPSIRRAPLAIKQTISDFTSHVVEVFPLKKMAFAAAALILVLIAPFQANSYYQNVRLTTDKVAADGRDGFMSLQESTAAILHSDLNGAQDSLNNALNKFAGAVDTMQTEHQWLQKMVSAIPVVNDEVTSRQQLIIAGQKIALGNTYLIKGVAESQAQSDANLTDRLDLIVKHLDAAIPNYQAALTNLSSVKEDALPLEYQAPFKDFKVLFATILSDLKNLSELGKTIQEVFGGQGTRRYLLTFQNPSELRATGGFIGSFAVVDVRDGKITNMSIPAGGSYDLKGQLSEILEPPTPMLLTASKWQFQDSNWYPDFPTSAEKAMWFYRKSRNVTTDGVIAINATVLERLLSIIGPIQDDKRNLDLNSENALETIQTEVESKTARATKKPKQIIADLAPQFLDYFKNIKAENILPILTNLQEALSQKEIQAYFTDTKTEQTVKEYGWGGQITPTNDEQDYLMVVNTNIAGQKSDARMKQAIDHQSVINDDGSITNTVVITRAHTGTADEAMYGATNIDYMRVYVPSGSELVEASGFTWPDESRFRAPDKYAKPDTSLSAIEKELSIDTRSGTRITSEFGKTNFSNWVITEPGQTTQVKFVYRLPFKAKISSADNAKNGWQNLILGNNLKTALHYQLLVQKQSGSDSTFTSQVILPTGLSPLWQDGTNIKPANNGVVIENMNLDKDYIWSMLAQTK